MLEDGHSDYKQLQAFQDTSAKSASRVIIDWNAAFGIPNGFMQGGPAHFKNETVHYGLKLLKLNIILLCRARPGVMELLNTQATNFFLCSARLPLSSKRMQNNGQI